MFFVIERVSTIAPSRRYPFFEDKGQCFSGWMALFRNRYFRTFVFKRRTRIWVGGGQLWRLCNDERGGEGRGREFRFISRISSFRYVPFFLEAPPFCSPLKRPVKYGMISVRASNGFREKRTFTHVLEPALSCSCPFLASLESWL